MEASPAIAASPFDLASAVESLVTAIAARGFVFAPWQIATYVTAVRTKPFLILAGVSGTGKSRLPAIVSELTGGQRKLLPVRPDWTDSSDVLGYVDLQGEFRPGALIQFAREADKNQGKHHVCIIDEMNLARVEQYFAEILSRIEDRDALGGQAGFVSSPLLSMPLKDDGEGWSTQRLPGNLALVGTVNMDESTHAFSRKVLDRAFTIEISDVDLSQWETTAEPAATTAAWPVSAWASRALRLGDFEPTPAERSEIERAIGALSEINAILLQAQLQVGYRVRDEVALFLVHAMDIAKAFVTSSKTAVDPLDIALQMKILPRIVGGSSSVRAVVLQLLGWANDGAVYAKEDDASPVLAKWKASGRASALDGARYPRTAARLALMFDRLLVEGYTSYWL